MEVCCFNFIQSLFFVFSWGQILWTEICIDVGVPIDAIKETEEEHVKEHVKELMGKDIGQVDAAQQREKERVTEAEERMDIDVEHYVPPPPSQHFLSPTEPGPQSPISLELDTADQLRASNPDPELELSSDLSDLPSAPSPPPASTSAIEDTAGNKDEDPRFDFGDTPSDPPSLAVRTEGVEPDERAEEEEESRGRKRKQPSSPIVPVEYSVSLREDDDDDNGMDKSAGAEEEDGGEMERGRGRLSRSVSGRGRGQTSGSIGALKLSFIRPCVTTRICLVTHDPLHDGRFKNQYQLLIL